MQLGGHELLLRGQLLALLKVLDGRSGSLEEEGLA